MVAVVWSPVSTVTLIIFENLFKIHKPAMCYFADVVLNLEKKFFIVKSGKIFIIFMVSGRHVPNIFGVREMEFYFVALEH